VAASRGGEQRGWYLAGDVGRLAGVTGYEIGQWARRGYIKSSRSDGRPRVYSYRDVAEAMLVHELLERGLPLGEIRTTIERTYQEHGDWPLQDAPLATVGVGGRRGSVLVLRKGNSHLDIGRGSGAQAWLPTLGEVTEVSQWLRHGGWVIRQHPEITHIEVDPDRLSGRPTIRGRRVPVDLVAELARVEGGEETLRDGYDLSSDEVRDAVAWFDATEMYGRAA
jgi:uncharacterized protein (DUF433 family)/DNA-binding transcriptional MerR regulator